MKYVQPHVFWTFKLFLLLRSITVWHAWEWSVCVVCFMWLWIELLSLCSATTFSNSLCFLVFVWYCYIFLLHWIHWNVCLGLEIGILSLGTLTTNVCARRLTKAHAIFYMTLLVCMGLGVILMGDHFYAFLECFGAVCALVWGAKSRFCSLRFYDAFPCFSQLFWSISLHTCEFVSIFWWMLQSCMTAFGLGLWILNTIFVSREYGCVCLGQGITIKITWDKKALRLK